MNFNEIYQNYYTKVYYYLKRTMWKGIDACNIEEIINKSFYISSQKLDVERTRTYEQHITRIVFNVMRNAYAYKRRYYDKNMELMPNHYNISTQRDLLDYIIKKEQKEVIWDALNKLKTFDKKIIILYFYYDFNYREISKILNINYKKTSYFLKCALDKLKNKLDKTNYEFDY